MPSFIALSIASFVLGVVLHVIFYEPTNHLPLLWRNMSRYALGVSTVLIVEAVAILLLPGMTAWQVYGTLLVFFAMAGLGVATGYVWQGD